MTWEVVIPKRSPWGRFKFHVKWLLGWRYVGCVGIWKLFHPKRNSFVLLPYYKNIEDLLGPKIILKCGRSVEKSTTLAESYSKEKG